ncbi:interleukin 15, like isoform X2 [Centropristis striata]|uniref:interleukin 15, like isoform X2 n=1 Tax=Centropristis striata TaxID=184440 RepID=UPI0027DF3D49|nr:interleukin 15, like isoform X2 [Centropristis striata]
MCETAEDDVMMILLRGRIAVASAYLCFVCLLAVVSQPVSRPCSKDIIKRVKSLIEKEPQLRELNCTLYTPTAEDFRRWLDCRLYTPTVEDFRNCPRSTLKCFADELQVLIEEWDLHRLKKLKLNTRVENLALTLNQTDPECLQCELLKEENAKKFLQSLQETIEMANLRGCP